MRFLIVAELGGGDLDGASYCKIHGEVSSSMVASQDRARETFRHGDTEFVPLEDRVGDDGICLARVRPYADLTPVEGATLAREETPM